MSKRVVFVRDDAGRADRSTELFVAVCKRMGLPWSAEVSAVAHGGYVVAFAPLPGAEVWPADADLNAEVNDLIARLFTGGPRGTRKPPPPAPPPPPVKKVIHTVKVGRETAGRKGKGVTVVSDLPLGEDALKELATKLKNACGTGGTAKDGRIEIQGDHRDRLIVELEKLGYKAKRAGG